MAKIIQIDFKRDRSQKKTASSRTVMLDFTQALAQVPGLIQKIWMINNETTSKAGGIYLFEDEASVFDYFNGTIFNRIVSDPNFEEIVVKSFELNEKYSFLAEGSVTDILRCLSGFKSNSFKTNESILFQ
ncbi:MAG: hypothetical protein N4J56_003417 [Chroococcidiopsis sp. SAG 2025]|uniref:YdhR family protein n=1 Tax=Chroococcidiopsis sp. SAG 2025 TaxID=171389 RepID=UPI002937190D|nr:YdhR family protein [Chroococcidiopsis sp. SAG 2025]MDV2993763.1 hypothetical protein [Chroococcidiopsis sp. SAG 2025]